jgi:hypothetical protein
MPIVALIHCGSKPSSAEYTALPPGPQTPLLMSVTIRADLPAPPQRIDVVQRLEACVAAVVEKICDVEDAREQRRRDAGAAVNAPPAAINLGMRRHRMRHFDVDSFFDIPSGIAPGCVPFLQPADGNPVP